MNGAESQQSDILIIGAGHNGLVCAFYLADRGYKVTVLESRGVVGGAAVTEEFHPGFRNSTASYTVGPLSEEETCLRSFCRKTRELIPEARLHHPPAPGWSQRSALQSAH